MAGPWERYQRQPAPAQDAPDNYEAGSGPWIRYTTQKPTNEVPVAPPRSMPPAQPEGRPGLMELLKGAYRFTLPGMLQSSSDAFNTAVEQSAYGAGGRVTDALAGSVSPEVAAGAGYATNLGVQSVPVLLGGALAKAPAQDAGRSLMRGAIKASESDLLKTGKVERAIETMLKEGYNVSPGSMTAIQTRVHGLGKQIEDILSTSTATVDKAAVADRLRPLLQRLEKQATPGADSKAVAAAWTEFVNHPLLNGNQIPVKLANEIKKGTYQALSNKVYGELGGASQEAQKALARGLREEIATAVPAVTGPLAQQSALMNALNVANRGAQVAGNQNMLGIGALSNSPVAGTAFALDRSRLAKSLLARGLYSGGQPIGQAIGARIGMLSGEYQDYE